jgi:hypothetical protein
MKAPFALNSAIEKTLALIVFLPVIFLAYPELAVAANPAQTNGKKALVFEISSKSAVSLKSTEKLLTYDELAAYDANTNINVFLVPKVQAFLESKGSPLAPYASEIVKQPQWQRALAISYVESNYGKRCADNNCSGIGGSPSHKSWRRYPTKLEWFKDLTMLLEKPTYKEKYTSCNTMNGVYNAGSHTWVNGCNSASNQLLALTAQAEQERFAYIHPTMTTATAELTIAK